MNNTNTLNLENTTASSSLSQSDTPSVYSTKYKFTFQDKEDIKSLESLLSKSLYINDDILSVDDVLIFEKFRTSKQLITQKEFPKTFKWVNELERMLRNWRISKNKNKGSTFCDFVKNAEIKYRKEKEIRESDEKELINGLTKDLCIDTKNNVSSLSPVFNSKLTNSPKYKKLNEYSMEIGIKFKENIEKNWSEIAFNLNIICQVYLPRGTEVEPVIDFNTGERFAVIKTYVHKEKFDISYIAQDIKRTIRSVESVNVIDVKEIHSQNEQKEKSI